MADQKEGTGFGPEMYYVAVETSERHMAQFVIRASNQETATESIRDWVPEKFGPKDTTHTQALFNPVYCTHVEVKPLDPVDEDRYRSLIDLLYKECDGTAIHLTGYQTRIAEQEPPTIQLPMPMENEQLVLESNGKKLVDTSRNKGVIPKEYQDPSDPSLFNANALAAIEEAKKNQKHKTAVKVFDITEATKHSVNIEYNKKSE